MSAQPWHTQHYRPADEASVLGLLNEVFTIDSMDEHWWRWKYELNPAGDPIRRVAEAQGKIVGLRAFIPWRFEVQGDSVVGYQAVDTVTHPVYQRRGVFTQLTQEALIEARRQGAAFIFNFPVYASLQGYLKMGWHKVAEIRWLIKVVDLPRLIFDALLSKQVSAVRPLNCDPESAGRRSELMACLRNAGQLWRQMGHGKPIVPFRDSAFLEWRYGLHPWFDYQLISAGKNSKDGGYIVYRAGRRRGRREALLMDFVVPLGDDETARHLVTKAELAAKKARISYLATIIPKKTTQYHALRRAGFFPVPRKKIFFVVLPLDGRYSPEFLTCFDNWHLTLGDLDTL